MEKKLYHLWNRVQNVFRRQVICRKRECILKFDIIKSKEFRDTDRLKVLNYYSDKQIQCNNCGEPNIELLDINHIYGGGHRHVVSIRRMGSGIYTWLRLNNYPDGYNVLCCNCNWKDYLEKHLSKELNYSSEYEMRIKIMAFHFYSGGLMKCDICDEDDIDILTLDHINGRCESNNLTGSKLYRYILREGFPDGFRVLCRNCQRLEYNRIRK